MPFAESAIVGQPALRGAPRLDLPRTADLVRGLVPRRSDRVEGLLRGQLARERLRQVDVERLDVLVRTLQRRDRRCRAGERHREHVHRARRVARPHERVGQARDLARILVAARIGGQPGVDRAGGDPLQEQVRGLVVLRRRELVHAVRGVEVQARMAHELAAHVPAGHRDGVRLRSDVEAALVERATLLLELGQVAEGDRHRGTAVAPVLVLLGPDPAERVLRPVLRSS